MGLWDISHVTNPQVGRDIGNWILPELPSLDGIDDIQLNFETTGVRWWDESEVVGFSMRYGDKCDYFPVKHKPGGNLDIEQVRSWGKRVLRNKRITNTNTKFEVHNGKNFGWDFEEMGCKVSDISHYAGLLDDHRLRFSLDILAKDYLGSVDIPRLDESRMVEFHPAEVAPRSKYNVELVWQLRNVMWPKLTEEGLHKVRQLEDECIFATAEMERNGAKVNVDLLDQWVIESEKELKKCQYEIGKAIGRRYQETLFDGGKSPDYINPDSPQEMAVLFEKLKLPISRTAKGNPSFTGEVLKKIDHPVIKLVIRASKLIDIRIKLTSWAKSVNRSTGILRYALHQLRAQKDKYDDKSAGTISGRYSSTKIDTKNDEGTNIQSVMKPAKQRNMFGYSDDDTSHDSELFILRHLIIPETGQFFASDMAQVEFRLFVAESKSERLLQPYREDPKTSYHRMIHGLLKQFKPDLPYRRAKDVNFAYQYGAGPRKMAWMLGFITNEEFRALNQDDNWRQSPLLKETFEIRGIYGQAVPEAKIVSDQCMSVAKKRHYIKSILGRRSRFPNGENINKALNTRIQPSAADIMKQKLVEIYKERKRIGLTLRMTIHDELCGDIPDVFAARIADEILNRQSFKLPIPIIWESSIGSSWYDLQDISKIPG